MLVAAAHVSPVFMDPQATAAKAAEWIARAGREGVQLLVFPEVFLPGFPYWINVYPPLIQAGLNRRYHDLSVEVGGPEVAAVAQAAADAGVAVVIGASERGSGTRHVYNSALFIDRDGQIAGVHRKLKPTYAERYIWAEGTAAGLRGFNLAPGRIGALVCWEHTMNHARQALADDEVAIHAALWPSLSTMPGFDQAANLQIEAMMRNHALTAQCFVICAASPIGEDTLQFLDRELGPQQLLGAGGGWSAVIHPFAATLAGPVTSGEQLVIADISLSDRDDVKMWVDTTGHYARPDVFRFSVNR